MTTDIGMNNSTLNNEPQEDHPARHSISIPLKEG